MRVASLVLNNMSADSRVERSAAALSTAGYDVCVFALAGGDLPTHEKRDGYAIFRVASAQSSSWKQPLRKISQSRKRFRDLVEQAVAWHPDIVHANDLDTLRAGYAIKRKTGAKLIYDAHELYDEMLLSDRAHVSRAVLAYWRREERTLSPHVDALITVSDGLRDELKKRTGLEATVVRNAPDIEDVYVVDPLSGLFNRPKKPHIKPNMKEKIYVRNEPRSDPEALPLVVVLYQGRIGRGRSLFPLVEALSFAKHFGLVLQGPADPTFAEELRVFAQTCGVEDRINFIDPVPTDALQASCCAADIGYVVLDDTSLNNRYALPNKLMRYMMAGLPVIGSALLCDSTRLIEEEGIGLLCDPRDPSSVAEALKALEPAEYRDACSHNARNAALTRYNWESEQKNLLEVYRKEAGDAQ